MNKGLLCLAIIEQRHIIPNTNRFETPSGAVSSLPLGKNIASRPRRSRDLQAAYRHRRSRDNRVASRPGCGQNIRVGSRPDQLPGGVLACVVAKVLADLPACVKSVCKLPALIQEEEKKNCLSQPKSPKQ
jgi:hypothetical protein